MKLYSYSIALLCFVEVKWVPAKCAAGGIVIGTMLFFGIAKLNHSIKIGLEPRPVNTLAAENKVLQQQLNFLSPRVNMLEIQLGKLGERANELHKLLPRRKSVGDKLLVFTNAIEASKLRSSMAAANSPGP